MRSAISRKFLKNAAATERELLQATILELQASNSGDADADRRSQAEAWSRIAKLAAGKSETALDALILLARRALSSVPIANDPTIMKTTELVQAIETHPLAKTPQKLVALDLRIQENPTEKDSCIARAIADGKDADSTALTALAAWLNGFGEFQRELDTIPLEKALQSRDLFLQHLDALGALARWEEIKRLLEAERFPLDPVIQRMYLARCNAQLGQKAGAENNWQRALEAAGNDVQKLLTLANYAEKNGALDIAGAAYDSAAMAAPKLRGAQQGRLRVAQATLETKKIHAVLADMLGLWPNDTAIQNDEAYTRLLLLPSDPSTINPPQADQLSTSSEASTSSELIAMEKIGENLVQRKPTSLPHRTLLALARLKQHRPIAALEAYANIQAAPNALSPSALAVHAAVLAQNGHADDAKTEAKQIKTASLLPEEKMLIQNLL